MQTLLLSLILPTSMIAWLFITYFTAKIRKMLKGESYKSFFTDVLWPLKSNGSINIDIIPLPDLNKYSDKVINEQRIAKNIWVIVFWSCVVSLLLL